jgi:hypothetical protein
MERSPEGVVLRAQSSTGDRETAWVDDSLAAQRMEFVSPDSKNDFRALRQGNTIRIGGTIGGRQVDRALSIDGRPWFGILELSLAGFVLRGVSI